MSDYISASQKPVVGVIEVRTSAEFLQLCRTYPIHGQLSGGRWAPYRVPTITWRSVLEYDRGRHQIALLPRPLSYASAKVVWLPLDNPYLGRAYYPATYLVWSEADLGRERGIEYIEKRLQTAPHLRAGKPVPVLHIEDLYPRWSLTAHNSCVGFSYLRGVRVLRDYAEFVELYTPGCPVYQYELYRSEVGVVRLDYLAQTRPDGVACYRYSPWNPEEYLAVEYKPDYLRGWVLRADPHDYRPPSHSLHARQPLTSILGPRVDTPSK